MDESVCDKIGYHSHLEAMIAVANRRNKGRHKHTAYKCDRCGMFHVFTNTKNLRPAKARKMKKYKFRYEPKAYIPTPVMKKKKKNGR